jgi:hypothetical protein
MNDQSNFELRLAAAFDALSAAAPVDVDPAALAAVVTRGRRRGLFGPFGAAPANRWLVPVLLGLLLLGALAASIWVGSQLLNDTRRLMGDLATPQPSPVSAWEAIYLRADPDDSNFIDILAVRPNGEERLVRRIGTTIPGSTFPLSTYGEASENGWLAISTTSSGYLPVAAFYILNLSDPSQQPLTVPYPPVINGRWSPNGLFAASSAKEHTSTDWMSIDVVDPRTGSTVALGRIGLFGGGPSIVWARDGSGILDGSRLKPATGGPDVDVDPNLLFVDRRVGMGGRLVWMCQPANASPDQECAGVGRTTVLRVGYPNNAVDRFDVNLKPDNAVDWYSSVDPNLKPVDAIFANDGVSLLVTIERTEGQVHQAVVGRVDAPNQFVELASFDMANDGYDPRTTAVDPDDSEFRTQYVTLASATTVNFITGPVLNVDGTRSVAPAGTFAGYVLGSLAESFPGP